MLVPKSNNMTDFHFPLEQMYWQREDFLIVALTGITGSGCTALAELMSTPFKEWENDAKRSLEDMGNIEGGSKQDVVFYRKYETCHRFCSQKYVEPFLIIKYRNVLILTALELLAKDANTTGDWYRKIINLIKTKFDKSHELKIDTEDEGYTVPNDFTTEQLLAFGLSDELYNSFKALHSKEDKEDYRRLIYQIYFSESFIRFCVKLFDELKRRDYYAKNFFVHRLATSIRACGDPLAIIGKEDKYDNSHVFDIVKRITDIIKGYHHERREAKRRFVIDSIRNSLEILYLRERYNAFYMIAMHNDGNEGNLIKNKVRRAMSESDDFNALSDEEKSKRVGFITERLKNLNAIENGIESFEDGKFYGPDISRCVSESEIHIWHRTGSPDSDDDKRTFYSMGEQWMKIYSLIMRPGIITPSRDERCMSIAYVAKFNSGCISRQVGCTIVDKEFSVQSVGWNDPPSGQLPCQLRYVDELSPKDGECADSEFHIYSEFEQGRKPLYNQEKEPSLFNERLKAEYSQETLGLLSNCGLHYSYCFRSRYNSYTETKDQVNTRSLHAEENTMLRISRVGGKGLEGGTMYVTASPCVLCSKKAYQIGIKDIVYLDAYTDIAPELILHCGWDAPHIRPFAGVIGSTFYKLYRPFLPYKDELKIWEIMTK